MNILFVDDYPNVKVQHAIQYLKSQNVEFTYEIVKSFNSAYRYIASHFDKIDLAVIDLGLPRFDDSDEYDKLEGLRLVEIMSRKKITIPVIINSTTEIPNEKEYLESYMERNVIIKHVQFLDGKWLNEFLKQL